MFDQNDVTEEESYEVTIVCKAAKCRHNRKTGCELITIAGDSTLSLSKEAVCENWFTEEPKLHGSRPRTIGMAFLMVLFACFCQLAISSIVQGPLTALNAAEEQDFCTCKDGIHDGLPHPFHKHYHHHGK
jgi:hypothetical protein